MTRQHLPDQDQFPRLTGSLPEARSPELLELTDGARVNLRIAPVAKKLGGSSVPMLAYNGTIPGPTLRVQQGSELMVEVLNESGLDTTVHWHGLRLGNRNDGTAQTQPAIPAGGDFTYRLTFPDPGVYWYHPHIREDYGQEMGLYGAIVVVPSEAEYWPPVHRELVLTLDDILLERGRIAPFSGSTPTFTAMGRFGNVLLLNGEPEALLMARKSEVLRLYLINTANTRVFNVALPGARMKLVGSDSGRYEREQLVENVVLAPSERAVIDVLFSTPGRLPLEHRTPDRTYSLATITVVDEPVQPSLGLAFESLRTNDDMVSERGLLARHLNAKPDKTLTFVAEMDRAIQELGVGDDHHRAPPHHHGMHSHERAGSARAYEADGIEWEDNMVEANRASTSANTRWKLIDRSTGADGTTIDWRFRVGDRVKIRLVIEVDSDHPMYHPFHIHGAGRFLILSRDGIAEPNLVWKDTVLVLTGQVVDILLDVTNPGRWMAHCHIAEHHESGMMLSFDVEPQAVVQSAQRRNLDEVRASAVSMERRP